MPKTVEELEKEIENLKKIIELQDKVAELQKQIKGGGGKEVEYIPYYPYPCPYTPTYPIVTYTWDIKSTNGIGGGVVSSDTPLVHKGE